MKYCVHPHCLRLSHQFIILLGKAANGCICRILKFLSVYVWNFWLQKWRLLLCLVLWGVLSAQKQKCQFSSAAAVRYSNVCAHREKQTRDRGWGWAVLAVSTEQRRQAIRMFGIALRIWWTHFPFLLLASSSKIQSTASLKAWKKRFLCIYIYIFLQGF